MVKVVLFSAICCFCIPIWSKLQTTEFAMQKKVELLVKSAELPEACLVYAVISVVSLCVFLGL